MVRGWLVASVLVLGACGDDSTLLPDSAMIDVDLMSVGVSLDDFLELDPSSYDLDLVVGETGPATPLTVTNIGTTTRGPLAVSVSGDNADEVTITNDICSGVQLAG